MKVLDLHGNELRDGDTVSWQMPGGGKMLVKLRKVVPPGTLSNRKGDPSPGRLEGEFTTVLRVDRNSHEDVTLSDMIKTHDPTTQQAQGPSIVQ